MVLDGVDVESRGSDSKSVDELRVLASLPGAQKEGIAKTPSRQTIATTIINSGQGRSLLRAAHP
jgi:hypothetical protein